MQVGMIGLNHKLADVLLREVIARVCQHHFSLIGPLQQEFSYVLLSTCNRTEIYFSSPDLATTHSDLLRTLRFDISEDFEQKLYSFFGLDCFIHLVRVTAGMDSAVIAETEIQGQVKIAYEAAARAMCLPHEIHFLFQKALKIGKQVRASLKPMRGMPSIESTVYEAGSGFFEDLKGRRVLFIGASEINDRILKKLKTRGVEQITLCNRTSEKAMAIAEKQKVIYVEWHHASRWHEYDLVVVGTKYPDYLITQKDVPQGVLGAKMIIDLSVPRNVDPKIGKHPQITLLNIDQINQIVEKHRRLTFEEITQTENKIRNAVQQQMDLFLQKASNSQTALA